MGIFTSNDKRMNGMGKGDVKLLLNLIKPRLQTNESIESVIYSATKRVSYGLNSIPQAFVIATNKRVIYFQPLGAFKSNLKSFPYDQIKSIDMENGIVFSNISFYGTNNEFSIEKVTTPIASAFIELIESKRFN